MSHFKKHNLELLDRAKTASAVLKGIVEETAPHLLTKLIGEKSIGEDNQLLPYITSELLILGLHLTERISFERFESDKASGFINAMLPSIQQEFQPPIRSQLEHLYNTRNIFYGGFGKLYPDENETLEGTLLWEFGKILGSALAKSNPILITDISVLAMDFIKRVIDAYEKNKIFI
jgi:hypothetical protein